MLPCLSCKKEVSSEDAKVFAEVFLCQGCFNVAERLYQRGEAELRMMLLVLKESIRLAALKGELQFAFGQVHDMKKPDLISHLAKLADEVRSKTEQRGKAEPCTTIPSSEPTKQPAQPVVGKPPTNSSSE